jgi:ribose 1,5-bisphosphokinase PhnN
MKCGPNSNFTNLFLAGGKYQNLSLIAMQNEGKVLKTCMQERGRTKENEHMLEGLNCSFLCDFPTRGGEWRS